MGRRRQRGSLDQLADLVRRQAERPTTLQGPAPAHEDNDTAVFRGAVRDVAQLAVPERHLPPHRKLPPVPVQSHLDDYAVLSEIGADPAGRDDFFDTGEEEAYLRPGMGPDVLRKLRRLEWTLQAELSVRRLTQDEARIALSAFVKECRDRGHRCIRVVHGKGLQSPNREPVLKRMVKVWLARKDEVLAFCQAPAAAGGGGALIVLLKG